MPYLLYSQINALEEIAFIGGTDFTLEFGVFEEDGVTPIDLSGATIKWVLCPYGQSDYNVLTKTGVMTSTNVFEVTLEKVDTQLLSGKYIHQPVVTSFLGKEYRPSQGTILIQPAIPLQ
jgi:hypothetical protein